jgi:hypothetical protein
MFRLYLTGGEHQSAFCHGAEPGIEFFILVEHIHASQIKVEIMNQGTHGFPVIFCKGLSSFTAPMRGRVEL